MKKLLSILICVFIGVTAAWAKGTVTMNINVSGPENVGSAEGRGQQWARSGINFTSSWTAWGTSVQAIGQNQWGVGGVGECYENARGELRATLLNSNGYKSPQFTTVLLL